MPSGSRGVSAERQTGFGKCMKLRLNGCEKGMLPNDRGVTLDMLAGFATWA